MVSGRDEAVAALPTVRFDEVEAFGSVLGVKSSMRCCRCGALVVGTPLVTLGMTGEYIVFSSQLW